MEKMQRNLNTINTAIENVKYCTILKNDGFLKKIK